MNQRYQHFRLSEAELQSFHRDGYIGSFDLYDQADMEAVFGVNADLSGGGHFFLQTDPAPVVELVNSRLNCVACKS